MKSITPIKHLIALTVLIALGVSVGPACSDKKAPAPEVTGKGNGGDTQRMTLDQIRSRFTTLKPLLHTVFQSLRDLNQAEILQAGSTDLAEFPELRDVINTMTGDGSGNVFTDIDTAENFQIQEDGCLDQFDRPHMASTEAGRMGGPICFSLSELQEGTLRGEDTLATILVISVAAHELVHHFYDRPDLATNARYVENERIANLLQAFVHYQLRKFSLIETSTVGTNDTFYVDALREAAATTLAEVVNSGEIQPLPGTPR